MPIPVSATIFEWLNEEINEKKYVVYWDKEYIRTGLVTNKESDVSDVYTDKEALEK